MDIVTLAEIQDKNTAIFQKEYIKLVRKLITKYGIENPELKVQFNKQLRPLAIEMVKSGYNLGEQWIST